MDTIKKHINFSKKHILCAVSIILLLTGLTAFLFGHQRDARLFSQISSTLFVQEMSESTLNMHYTLAHPEDFGIHQYEAVLPLYNAADRKLQQTSLENILASLNNLDTEKLNTQDAYTHKLLQRSLTNALQLNLYPYYDEPLSPASGMQSHLPILLAEYTFRDKRDVEDYLKLLDQSDEYFAALLLFEQEKAAEGLLMPISSLEKVRNQCDTIVTIAELEKGTHFLQSTFAERLQPLITAGEINREESDEYMAQNNRLLKTVLCPAYEALSDGLFLLEDPAVLLTGLAAKPLGKEYYQYLLISETGSYRSIEDIEKLLSAQIEKEYHAMQAILQENPDLMKHYAAKGHLHLSLTDADSMLNDLQLRMRSQFPDLNVDGNTQPSVTIKSISPSLEKYSAPAFYLTAPIDDTDTNVIYINPKNSPKGLDLYTTLAHEGYPGHLYQTVYHNRTSLAADENIIRQLLWYGGYLEGWAIYVEFLSFDYASLMMEEENRSKDAISIQLEKHNRSLQLCLYSILDIMIHYENASYHQVAEVLEHFGVNNPTSASAIYTYIAENPCNYMKYYLGYLEILQLQEAAKATWGDAYSDYAFHCFYLDSGPSDFTSLTERLPASYPPSGKTD